MLTLPRNLKKINKNPQKTQVPPTNQTKLEGEKVQFTCEAKAMPGNVTVRWFREGSPVREVAALETRVTIRKDGSLIINPVSADDSGMYTCEVSNGIGEPQSASAFFKYRVSCQSDLHPNNTILTVSFSWCCTMLYKSKSSSTICNMDQR
uniref:Protein turtle n=1 Tax=Culex pipiens TaxID=7175 RepID=A0A8D8F5H0_CULPI